MHQAPNAALLIDFDNVTLGIRSDLTKELKHLLNSDIIKGKVAVQGWTEDSDLEAIAVAKQFEDAGVAALIVTDIDRDGTTMGFNVEAFGLIADAVAIPVIAAGGLASGQDIVRLKARKGTRIAGAVLGRALYNGAITPGEALKVAA